jgi:hypothetical protein
MDEESQTVTPKRRKLPWERPFLRALARTGNVSQAALCVGIVRRAAYHHRERHPDFSQAWDDALEQFADGLEAEAVRRAVKGVTRYKFYKGEAVLHPDLCRCGHLFGSHELDAGCREAGCGCERFIGQPYREREYSDTLLALLLKGLRSEKYKDNLGLSQEEIDAYIEARINERAEARANQIISRNGTAPPPPVTASQGNVLPDSGLASPAAGSPAPGPLSQERGPEPVHPEEFPTRPPWLPPEGLPPRNQANGP